MSTRARRRIIRDFQLFMRDPPGGVMASPYDEDMMHWMAVIFGPKDTIWEGGTFCLDVRYSENYPSKPPTVKFLTPCFHPNIYATGAICLDLLQDKWSAAYGIGAILTSIQSLLTSPNPASPANQEAAHMFVERRAAYDARVRRCVRRSLEFAI